MRAKTKIKVRALFIYIRFLKTNITICMYILDCIITMCRSIILEIRYFWSTFLLFIPSISLEIFLIFFSSFLPSVQKYSYFSSLNLEIFLLFFSSFLPCLEIFLLFFSSPLLQFRIILTFLLFSLEIFLIFFSSFLSLVQKYSPLHSFFKFRNILTFLLIPFS